MKSTSTRFLTLVTGTLLSALMFSGCSVDLDDYTFDDDELAEKGNKDGPPEGLSERCIEFCDGEEEICGFGTDISYSSKDDCFTLCEGYFEAEIDCRETHLDFAKGSDSAAQTHCPHTLEDGGNGVCPDARSNSCDRYCLRTGEACGFDDGGDGVFPDLGECRDACSGFSEGELECRFVQLGNAEEGEVSNCEDLLPDTGVCSN